MDRNTSVVSSTGTTGKSLSARRAWIEMVYLALIRYLINTSLSARRAWIEISEDWLDAGSLSRRSPQGERG